ncbi:TPA: ABC transporter permease [Salmonella enterica subsp. enterica serovar Hvittingfoss]|nr:ABC transporter permease [Salmonella enterica]HBJ5625418.1 ABC transporter permease [Salmonella enterica subsp. enterica serovar Hvittingfoss]
MVITYAIKEVIKKTLLLFFMLFSLSFVTFYISRLAPGDPLQSFYNDALQSMTIQEIDAARHRLGLDGSIGKQYIQWLWHLLEGDFGISLKYKRPVIDVIKPLIWNTIILGGSGYILVFFGAVIIALLCARFEDTLLDRLICRIGTISFYVPTFWLGIILVLIFSVNLRWLPGSGAYSIGKSDDWLNRLEHMVLPVVVIVVSHIWFYAYMIRNKLLDEVRKDYVILARSKGIGRTRVLTNHCLRNILPTIVNIMAISTPHILSGTYVTETVFNYPGIGLMSVSSAKYHDYNLLMILVLITGLFVFISSLIAQFINEIIDPRMCLTENEIL